MLPVMYHGTTRRRWNSKGNGVTTLYLTSNRKDAVSYADESASNEAYDHKKVEGVVVEFQPEVLQKLVADRLVELDPDWGWVDGQEAEARNAGKSFSEPSWQASLAACYGICLSGFKDEYKSLAAVTPMLQEGIQQKPQGTSRPRM